MAETPRRIVIDVEADHTGLATLLNRQEWVQHIFLGCAPKDLDPQRKMMFLLETAYALTDEVHEATAETGWKPWSSSTHINRSAYVAELMDVFIFWMNLCLIAGVTPEEIFRGVMAKQEVNIKRQRDGYDGQNKCPVCKRAYDDPSTLCSAMVGCVDQMDDPLEPTVEEPATDPRLQTGPAFQDTAVYQCGYCGVYQMTKDQYDDHMISALHLVNTK